MLYLIHSPVNIQALRAWATERNLGTGAGADAGYAMHKLLSQMIGPAALQPFRVQAPAYSKTGTLYGYSAMPASELRRMAEITGTPDALNVLDITAFRSKKMPTLLDEGRRLGFDVRARPVKRQAPRNRKGVRGKTIEIDISRTPSNTPPTDRNTRGRDYARWLEDKLRGTARIECCRLASYRPTRPRRDRGGTPNGPDAVLQGDLTITNPDGFAALLARGIGRHKAYGYGMLLLRPPAPAARRVPTA